MAAQLILPMGVDDSPGLDNFLDTPNKNLLAFLKQQLQQRVSGQPTSYAGIFIWGESSSGKSHLISALSQWVKQNGGKTLYLEPASPEIKAGKENPSGRIYMFDDVETFISDSAAERQFLTLLERIKQQNAMLLITARRAVKGLKIGLPDLSSRLQAMDGFELLALRDDEKREVLRQRANQRGILLGDDVLNWLFTHTARDLGMLLNLLERMDVRSLSQKRKVTIPLIKSILQG
jgi:DnaA family protein